MQQFTQKYAIIQLFEEVPVGAQFSSSNWPLHSTIADTFAVDWDVSTMTKELADLLGSHDQAASVVEGDRFFGDEGEVQVALLRKSRDLERLHYSVIELLEKGGWKPNDPHFAKAGFLPHSTVQPHDRVNEGDEVTFNALSVIDFFPDEDPYQRQVIATIEIGQ